MLIKSKLTKQDFINVNFILLYSKLSMKIFTGLVALFLLLSVTLATFSEYGSFSQVIIPLAMLTAMPLLTYFGAIRNFTANNRFSEAIEYRFDNEYLSMKGESFNSQLTWNKVYKVTQTKNWIMIWQNKQFANPIPKGDIGEEQISDLKEILDNHKVKNNL